MTDKRLYIATPMFGGMCYGQYMLSMTELTVESIRREIPFQSQILVNESLITRARNNLAHDFLKSTATHLLFIDADIEFNPNHVFSMLEQDLDVLCGVYPTKAIDWGMVRKAMELGVPDEELNFYIGRQNANLLQEGPAQIAVNKPCEVLEAATGFMMIKREVLEALKPHVPTYTKGNAGRIQGVEHTYAFFETGIDDDGTYLSEDFMFCKLWRQIGGKVHIAPWVTLGHSGTFTFYCDPLYANRGNK